MNAEEWRPVVGYEGLYEVSSHGRVRSVARPSAHPNHKSWIREARVLKLRVDTRGYVRVNLYKNPARASVDVHPLVAAAFLGPRGAGMHVCHNDGNRENNTLENLRYDTPSGNQRDMRRHGTHFWANKTHCPHGHPYSPENTDVYRGRRNCRACRVEYQAARRAARKAAVA